MTPEQTLAQWQQWGVESKPRLTQALANGKTNQAFLLTAGKQQFVLRLYSDSNKALYSQAHANQQSVNAIGLAPRLLYSHPDNHYSVSEYLPGDTLNENIPLTNNDVKLLCDAVSRYQKIPVLSCPIDYKAVLTGYRHQLINCHRWQPDDEQLFCSILKLCDELKRLHSAPVLSHHDLNAYNIIRLAQHETRFGFIDWEFSCTSFASFDYAILLVELNIDSSTLANISGIAQHTLDTSASIYRYLCKLYWLTHTNKNRA
jgi:hypothetical protein